MKIEELIRKHTRKEKTKLINELVRKINLMIQNEENKISKKVSKNLCYSIIREKYTIEAFERVKRIIFQEHTE